LRKTNSRDIGAPFEAARHLVSRLNRRLLGPDWQRPSHWKNQAAVFGVVEGDALAFNIHMHLVVYRNGPIDPLVMKNAKLWLLNRGMVSEFWYDNADRAKLESHIYYIFKGVVRHGPSNLGADISDRVYCSPSLERIR